MYSYVLYEIIYVIFLDVGTHLGAPGTLEVGLNCQNFKKKSLVLVASNFQDAFILAILNYL